MLFLFIQVARFVSHGQQLFFPVGSFAESRKLAGEDEEEEDRLRRARERQRERARETSLGLSLAFEPQEVDGQWTNAWPTSSPSECSSNAVIDALPFEYLLTNAHPIILNSREVQSRRSRF